MLHGAGIEEETTTGGVGTVDEVDEEETLNEVDFV